MESKELPNKDIPILKIIAAGMAILILVLLLYNPSGVLNGIYDALQ